MTTRASEWIYVPGQGWVPIPIGEHGPRGGVTHQKRSPPAQGEEPTEPPPAAPGPLEGLPSWALPAAVIGALLLLSRK